MHPYAVKKIHGNNNCYILDGDYFYGGKNRGVFKEGY